MPIFNFQAYVRFMAMLVLTCSLLRPKLKKTDFSQASFLLPRLRVGIKGQSMIRMRGHTSSDLWLTRLKVSRVSSGKQSTRRQLSPYMAKHRPNQSQRIIADAGDR